MLLIYGDERAAESVPREQMTETVNAYWPIPRPCGTPRFWSPPTG
jgi:hypothetical protein